MAWQNPIESDHFFLSHRYSQSLYKDNNVLEFVQAFDPPKRIEIQPGWRWEMAVFEVHTSPRKDQDEVIPHGHLKMYCNMVNNTSMNGYDRQLLRIAYFDADLGDPVVYRPAYMPVMPGEYNAIKVVFEFVGSGVLLSEMFTDVTVLVHLRKVPAHFPYQLGKETII